MRGRLWDERLEAGQMVVELCVVMPVILMVAVAIVDGLVFAAACAKFDHLAPQAVLAVAASPEGTSFDAGACSAEIEGCLFEEMAKDRAEVSVEASDSGRVCEFTCKLSMTPWPLVDAGGSVMGMGVPVQLSREFRFCVRPYVIGEL